MSDTYNTNEEHTLFPRDEVRSAIARGIQQATIQHTHQQKTKPKKKLVRVTVATAATLGMLVGTSYLSPTFASTLSQLPIIGSIFKESDFPGLKQASEQGLTSTFNETQTNNGISVTINEVLYDPAKITVSFTAKSKKSLSEHYFKAGMDMTINKKRPKVLSGTFKENKINDTVRTGISSFDVTEEMPNSFQLGLTLHGSKGEKWSFSVPIQKIVNVKTIAVRHEQTSENIHLEVQELSLSPAGVSLSYKASEKGNIHNPNLNASFLEFRILDENGKEIPSHSGGSSGEFRDGKWHFSGNKTFDPIKGYVQKLKVVPYVLLPSSGGGVHVGLNQKETILGYNLSTLKPVKFQPFTITLPLEQE
ncbi:DUF4179 domain-containing protein [Ectobacillus antri]|jgi:hypothetical protein|uniref:DUF4179 domain-containing protein n=1 Tax=Ectobacillus antri TaxID=2486280 RepID=A0ABT6H6F8_9BACI|nr:DUF4179 domain-containing protein [Ectobacillus antri]MDG4657295.1 DUF4179 domain-containing protein [Ectobacillus antri]MDG5754353.1 DUF4179 domain-containing protein [Ectobacillus antri]